jgi:hypothetical protein
MGVAASSVFDCATNPLDVLPNEGDDSSIFSTPSVASSSSSVIVSPSSLGYDVPTPLRSSSLWTLQRSFYEQHAARAWTDGIVPHFVSSNSFIARAYAKAAIGLLRDIHTAYNARKEVPPILTILEVGAGHGKLGYLIVESLLRFRAFLPPRQDGALPFRYVLTDAISENIEAMRLHPSLRDFFASGAVDAGVWNAEEGLDDANLIPNIQLISGSTLSPSSLNGAPLLVVANYVFNSLRTDAFRVPRGGKGGLEQANVTLSSTPGSLPIYSGREGEALSRTSITWSYSPLLSGIDPANQCSENLSSQIEQTPLPQVYLNDPLLSSMLHAYAQGSGLRSYGGSILFPLGAIAATRSLLNLSSGRLVMLVGDKGHSYLGEMTDAGPNPQRDPHMALHGSFSFMVNFHALRQWAHSNGGATLISPHNEGFKACVFAFGGINAETPLVNTWPLNSIPKLILTPPMFPAPLLQLRPGNAENDTYGGMLTSVTETILSINEKQRRSYLFTKPSSILYDSEYPPIFAPAGCSLSAYPLVLSDSVSLDSFEKEDLDASASSFEVLTPGPNGFFMDDDTVDLSVNGNTSSSRNGRWTHKLLKDFSELRSASVELFNSFTPEDFATLQRGIKEESPAGAPSLKHALALLRLSQHDSEVFLKFKQVFIDKSVVPQCPENQAKDLRFDVERVYAGFFPLQSSHDVNFELARICMGMRDHTAAIEFFNQSNKIAGEHHVTWHNLGICFFFLNDLTSSINAFTRALSMNPSYVESQSWLTKVQQTQKAVEKSTTPSNAPSISPGSVITDATDQ